MAISAALVKELRERTRAGMMECKKALEATQGDIEAAVGILRASGQAKASKRASKVVSEGTIVVRLDDRQQNACMIEVNCETDFVGRSEQFLDFARNVAACALQSKVVSVDELLQLTMPGNGQSIDQARQELIAKVGENVQIRRMKLMHSDGLIGSYIHGSRIGVLVAINRQEAELARDIAMHVAATNPLAIDEAQVPQDVISREREIYLAQSKESGKPENIIEKMVSGRVAKFMKEVCLVDQPFIKDTEKTVGALLKAHQAQVIDFARFEVGEGIEKQTQDFAEEVRSQLGK
ncbi:MAG: elongation factor Ts [Proteobacteria bacterium]|nr:elongation factor Ts [Pseudomonadota bacterium]